MRFIKGSVVLVVFFMGVSFTSNVKAMVDANEAYAGMFRYHAIITVHRIIPEQNISTILNWDCNGAIISTKSVITSYKCVAGYESRTSFQIKIGCDIYAEECTFYDSFTAAKFTPEHAIALIQVTAPRPIIFNDRIQPVMLPTSTIYRHLQMNRYSVYHATSTSEIRIKFPPRPWIINYLNMQIANMSECIQHLPNSTIHSSSICVKEIGTGHGSLCSEWAVPLVYLSDITFVGDYHGDCEIAYLSTATLIGIFDYTNADCTAGGPSLFFKIEAFVDWIWEQIKLE